MQQNPIQPSLDIPQFPAGSSVPQRAAHQVLGQCHPRGEGAALAPLAGLGVEDAPETGQLKRGRDDKAEDRCPKLARHEPPQNWWSEIDAELVLPGASDIDAIEDAASLAPLDLALAPDLGVEDPDPASRVAKCIVQEASREEPAVAPADLVIHFNPAAKTVRAVLTVLSASRDGFEDLHALGLEAGLRGEQRSIEERTRAAKNTVNDKYRAVLGDNMIRRLNFWRNPFCLDPRAKPAVDEFLARPVLSTLERRALRRAMSRIASLQSEPPYHPAKAPDERPTPPVSLEPR